MTALRAGDYVLSAAGETSRVVFNQHVAAGAASPVVAIDYGAGSLELTPDHVIKADGASRGLEAAGLRQRACRASTNSRLFMSAY